MNQNFLMGMMILALLISTGGVFTAFLLAYMHRRKSSRAATLVWLALGINVFSRVAGLAVNLVVSRWYSPATLATTSATLQPVFAALSVISLVLLVRAAFVDREQTYEQLSSSAGDDYGSVPTGERNPYAAPR